MIVPTMRGLVESDARQVVRVIVQGGNPKATVQFEQVSIGDETPSRQHWDEKLYFESLDIWGASPAVQTLARELRELGGRFPASVTFNWGTGKKGVMVLKRHGGGLVEVKASGTLRFRPNKFPPGAWRRESSDLPARPREARTERHEDGVSESAKGRGGDSRFSRLLLD